MRERREESKPVRQEGKGSRGCVCLGAAQRSESSSAARGAAAVFGDGHSAAGSASARRHPIPQRDPSTGTHLALESRISPTPTRMYACRESRRHCSSRRCRMCRLMRSQPCSTGCPPPYGHSTPEPSQARARRRRVRCRVESNTPSWGAKRSSRRRRKKTKQSSGAPRRRLLRRPAGPAHRSGGCLVPRGAALNRAA